MKPRTITIALLIAAAVLETAGVSGAPVLLLAAGVGCEVAFWMRLVRSRSVRSTS